MLLYRTLFVIFIFYLLGCEQTAHPPSLAPIAADVQKPLSKNSTLSLPSWGWLIPGGIGSIVLLRFLFKNVFFQTYPYYGEPKDFPMQYHHAFPGLSKDRFERLGTRGDGSCWARAFLLILLDRIASDRAFFERTLAKLQSEPAFWEAIPGTSHVVDIAAILQLLRQLQPLPEEKRLTHINNTHVDAMLTSWIRHIVARMYTQANPNASIAILNPIEFGGDTEYIELSAYFDMAFHWVLEPTTGVDDNMPIEHFFFSSGKIQQNLTTVTGYIPLPLWDSLEFGWSHTDSKMVIVRINQNHAEILKRKPHTAPFVSSRPLNIWNPISWDDIHFLLPYPSLYNHLDKNDALQNPIQELETRFDTINTILLELLALDLNSMAQLIQRIEQSRQLGPDFVKDNSIEPLLWFLNRIQNASSPQEKEYTISRHVLFSILGTFVQHLAIHYNLEVQKYPGCGDDATWHAQRAQNHMKAWRQFLLQ